jgi:dihydroorotase
VRRTTANPAAEIHRADLGHLGVGAPADIAVFRVERGSFGFVDVYGARLTGSQRLACELTLREGRVMYDLNGLTRAEWDRLPAGYGSQSEPSWDGVLAPWGKK